MKQISFLLTCLITFTSIRAAEPVNLGSRRELLVDDHLIDRMSGVTLKMHQPQAHEVALICDAPWARIRGPALMRWPCAGAFLYNRRTPISHALRLPHSPR